MLPPVMGGQVPSENTNDPNCGICAVSTGAREVPHGILYQDDLWVVRHSGPPYGVAGWLTLMTRRHCPEPASFNDEEARSFGPTLRHFEGVLREITGALGSTRPRWARASRTSTATWSRATRRPLVT